MEFQLQLAKIFWLIFVFCIGSCIGSLLNVVVARLPLEKSIVWPSSRCGSCLQPIRGLANLPIVSYLFLRGRCFTCGARFSSRYFWVELGTAIAFTALFYFDILQNMQGRAFIREAETEISMGWVPWRLWVYFLHHATLMSFLIATALCDLDGKMIPMPLTLTGTVVGLVFATLMPWPWPGPARLGAMPHDQPWFLTEFIGKIPSGVYAWPVWGPLPDWLGPGTWQLGLLTGFAGAAAGNLMMRSVRFLFEQGMKQEALGLGDADLMMMAGAFIGWQLVVMSFFIGTFAALFLTVPLALWRKERDLPFAPGLAIGVMITMLFWNRIGPSLQFFFFEWFMLFIVVTMMGGGMFFASLLLRRKEIPSDGDAQHSR